MVPRRSPQSSPNAGTYTVTASYSGDANDTASSGTTIQTVTVITITPSTLPNATVGAAYNQTLTALGGQSPYTYSITVGALPAGLTLSSGGVISGTPTAGGTFNFTVQAIDANGFNGSQAYTLTVNAPTITIAPVTLPNGAYGTAYSQTLTASGGTAPYTFTLTAGALPTGLTLASNGVISGAPTQSGTFTFTIQARDSSTGSGPYTGHRTYTISVTAAGTTTTLTSAPNPSTSGQAVTFTATVTAAAGQTPTGTVTFRDGAAALGTAAVTNGTATFSTAALAAGTHSVTAAYSGDAANAPSTLAVVTQTDNPVNGTTTLTSAQNPSATGQAVTFTATVTGQTPTGTVTFRDGAAALGAAAVTNGTATFSTAALAAGTHSVTAAYSGDAANAPSTSAVVTQTVNPAAAAATTTSVTASPNPALVGQVVTLTATVAAPGGGTPTAPRPLGRPWWRTAPPPSPPRP